MARFHWRKGLLSTYTPRLEPLEDRCLLSTSANALGQLPLTFEANVGQADAAVRYLAHGSGYTLALTDQGATLALQHGDQQDTLQLQLVGDNAAPALVGLDAQAGYANYLLGNDPTQWHANVPLYGRVAFQQVYPGIDLVFYGNDQQQLEYDLDLAPGADPNQVGLRFEGAQGLAVDGQGNLVVQLAGGDVVQQAPIVYQTGAGGNRTLVPGAYLLRGDGTVGIHLGAHDAGQALVLDPVLTYSTYLGGSALDDGYSLAVDPAGNVYVTGHTTSPNFPTAGSPVQASHFADGSNNDAFVAKLNAAGTALLYATYLGGSGGESGNKIAVDASGNACIIGNTSSPNFPTANAALPTYGGGTDAFVAKLNATGNALIYSTYLGGNGLDYGQGIAVDAVGNAYVVGYTQSSNFPTDGTVGTISPNNSNAFVVKLNAAGSTFVYTTLLGGSGNAQANAVAVDASGHVYVTGYTNSSNFPTVNAVQPTFGGNGFNDAFVAKLTPNGKALEYSTYLGGSNGDAGDDIALDSAGNAYVTGDTLSSNFPTRNAVQAALGGGLDAFVAKLNATGNALVYATYLGGSGDDHGHAIAVDLAGNAYVCGPTQSTNFPTASPLQAASGGGLDAFVAKLNATGTVLVHSTYLGGSSDDASYGIAVDELANAYLTGYTYSTNFPTASPLQAAFGGAPDDAFIAKMVLDPPPTGPLTFTAPAGSGPNNLTLRLRQSPGLGNIVELLDNGVLVAAKPLANTTAVQITGAANVADNLALDNRFGGPVQVPAGITFDGGTGGGNTLTVTDTAAADTLTLSPGAATFDAVESLTFSNVQSVTAGGAANDTVALNGAASGSTFSGTPGSSTLTSAGDILAATGFGNVTANAGNAHDQAYLSDASGTGTLTGTTAYARLATTNPNVTVTAVGFGVVSAFATPGTDAAFLYDGPDSDLFVGTPTYAYLQAGGSFNVVSGFKSVAAHASGGGDLALLYDSAGDDTFSSSPAAGSSSSSVLSGFASPGVAYSDEADGFLHVRATAGQGGQDTAYLLGPPAPAILRGAPAASSLTPTIPGYDLLVLNFFTVNATAGSSGDAAYLTDSPGNDTLTARPDGSAALDYQTAGHINLSQYPTVAAYGSTGSDTAYLFGHAGLPNSFTAGPVAPGGTLINVATLSSPNAYSVSVVGFATVRAFNGSANDLAQLTSAPGDDTGSTFVGTPQSSYLAGANSSFFNLAAGFAHVFATSSGKGTDVALLYGSAGDDTFFGSRPFSYLAGAGYFNQVSNFFKVDAIGGQGGTDSATLHDSGVQSDTFEGQGTTGQVFGTDYVVEADSFSAVAAVASAGSSDTLYLQMVSYVFSQSGPWRNVQGTGPTPPGSRPVA
jgi:hypothetical protein